VSVDCTDCKIEEPQPFSKKWFSHKFSGAGLRYEVGLSIERGDIVWINGPFNCGDWPDVRIFRFSLRSFLDENERVEADNGYVSEDPMFCKAPGGISTAVDGRGKERSTVRARHETVNARLKNFEILKQVYRHDLLDHSDVFRAAVVLIQLAIENGEPLFQVIREK
jgi:hypothetical protein